MKRLDIVCPVFNEAEVIESFFNELAGSLRAIESRYSWRVIFVLDQSSDGTEKVIEKICDRDPRAVLISLSTRFGHQASLIAGMDHSDGDYCVVMDCDLEHPPALIPELLAKAEEGYDVVFTVREYAEGISAFKKFTSSLYYRFINVMTDLSLVDGSAYFRLISAKVRDVFKNSIREQNQFHRGLISWIGFRSTHVPFQSRLRQAGASKYNLPKLIRFAVTGIVSFSKKPLRLAVYLGFFISALALLAFVYHIYVWFRYSNLPPGWTTLALLVSLIGGFQLFFMGIIGEYLGFIFDEVKRRPLYVVDKKLNLK